MNDNKERKERERLVALRDAAERQGLAADHIYHEAWVARRDAVQAFNRAAMAVYDFDVANGAD